MKSFLRSTNLMIAFLILVTNAGYLMASPYILANHSHKNSHKKILSASLPVISYSSPNTYTVGKAITPLMPAGTGVAVAAYNAPVNLGSGFNQPAGVAIDAAGNVYVADYGNNLVEKIPVVGGAPVILASTFKTPSGIAVDAAGNVYVADQGDNNINKIPAGGGAPVILGSGFNRPDGVAVDAAGNVYVADQNNNAIKKIPAGGGATLTLGSGFNNPNGVAVDAAGNVYVVDADSSFVNMIPANGGPQVKLGSGFVNPGGIAVDAAGNVYVTDNGNNAMYKLPAGGGAMVNFGAGFNSPGGVTVDAAGNVYAANFGNNTVVQIKPAGGYYINRPLPSGLKFDGNTGIVSGTPTVASPATNYTITGYNSSGSSSAVVNITVNTTSVTPPAISYTGPKTYVTGAAISPLSPTASGVSAPGYSAGTATLGSGFKQPGGVAIDAAGNIYVADFGNNAVKKIPAGGSTPVTIGSGFNSPTGVAVDAAGNVYVADYGNNAVKKIPAGGGAPVAIGSGFKNPGGIAVDAAGNLYVGEPNDSTVLKIPAGKNTPVVIGSGIHSPFGVAVDAAGNVYVADADKTVIVKILAGGGQVTLGSGFNNPLGVAVDAAGNVYVADDYNNAIKEILVSGGAPVTLGSGFNQPSGLAVSGAGIIYVGDLGNNAVKQINPVGGYYISPALPAGLSFNSITGAISGTPTAASPATNYTVAAYNTGGSATATLTITVNSAVVLTFAALPAKVYGAADFAPGAVSTAAITYTSSNPAVATIISGNIHITGAGNATITANSGGQALSQNLTVTAAPLTVTANNQFGIIGAALPKLTLTYSGFVNGDTQTNLIAQPTLTTTATSSSAMGYYPITVSGGVSNNYSFTYIGATLTMVTTTYLAAPIATKTYGNTDFYAFGKATSGIIYSSNNTAIATVDQTGNVHIVGAGTTSISVGNSNGHVAKTLVVNKAALTVTANNQFAIIGSVLANPTLTYSGFLNGDTPASLTILPTASTTATSSSPMGNYPITVGGGASNNYSFTYAGGTLTMVSTAYLAAPITKTYGSANFYVFGTTTSTVIYSSNNTAIATVDETGGVHIVSAGTTSINVGNNNGHIAKVLTINKAVLTATAANQVKTQGAANPALTYTLSGFVNGDTNASIATQPSVSTTATISSPAGSYPITVSGGVAANYTFTYMSGVLTVNPAITVPTISYSSPQTYTTGKTITPFSPVSSGVAAPGYNNAPVVVGSGFNDPYGVAVDQAGNVYVADRYVNEIKKIPVGGGSTIVVDSGFNQPVSIAVDASGNIYVADYGNNAIKKIPVGGGPVVTLGSGFNQPYGVAVDASGNVYVADYGNDAIKEIPGGAGTPVIIATGFSQPIAVAVDASGNVYVADQGNNAIKEIPVNGGATVTLVSGLNLPTGVAIDAAGNLFIAGYYSAEVMELPAGTSTPVVIGSGFAYPVNVATDAAGNVYVADFDNDKVKQIKPAGGYYIGPFLPAGINFNTQTGVISGTPTLASPATNYTVTAWNNTGSSKSTLNITINPPVIAGAPIISYPAPPTYTEGKAITPLNVTNTGGAVPAAYYAQVSTIAGSGSKGSVNGTGTAASFNNPSGVAIDKSGNFYIADQGNNLIRKITPAGVVTTFAGSGAAGAANGTGVAASFNQPIGLILDALGNVYVADAGNNMVRKITAAGVVTTLASGLNYPADVTIDGAGNIYEVDGAGSAVNKITPAGVVSMLAGNFYSPFGITIDAAGNLYVADYSMRVFKITPTGVVTVLAGSGATGSADGTGVAATFNNPNGVKVDAAGNVYVGDSNNNLVREISPAGVVTTLAGNGKATSTNGLGTAAGLNGAFGLVLDGLGNLFVTTTGDDLLRKITLTGYGIRPALPAGLSMSTAGTISGTPTAVSALTNYSITAGNTKGNGVAYINFAVNNAVNAASSPKIYTAAGNGTAISGGDNGPASVAGIAMPYAMVMDKAGNIYIATEDDNRVRRIDAITKNITTIAGTGTAGYSGDGGPAVNAQLNFVKGLPGLYVDAAGNLYIGDCNNNRVRKINAATQVITTIAGTGVLGNTGDGGLATAAELSGPGGILMDAANNIYIADVNNMRIRKIDAVTGNISTVISGLGYVERMAFDKNGNLYFGDEGKNTLNKIDAVTHNSSVIAGTGIAGYSGDGGTATAAQFNTPMVVVLDSVGNIYVGDQENDVIRKIDATTQVISTFAGIGSPGYSGDGGAAVLAQMNLQTDIVIDSKGIFYVDDLVNNVIRRIGGSASAQTITFSPIPSKAYGSADFSPSATASSGLPVAYTSSNTAVATILNGMIHITGTGTTSIIASQAGNAGYQAAASVSQNLTITAAPQFFNFPILSKVYGSPDFTGAVVASSGLPVTYTSLSPSVLTIVNGTIHIVGAGRGTLNVSQAGNADYQPLLNVPTTLVINPAPLTITANNQTKTTGTANPVLTASYTGFVNGDTQASLATLPTISTTASVSSLPATYPITVSGAISANYTFTYVAGILTVTATSGNSLVINDALLPQPNAFGTGSLAEPHVNSAVSPNGDGINDVLTIDNIANYPDNKLTIMNTKGSKLFEVSHYDNLNRVFDGHSNLTGTFMPRGTYFYILQYSVNGIIKNKTGYIVLRY